MNVERRGRKHGGLHDFIRTVVKARPTISTTDLRKRARARFGTTFTIDRHFPQVVWRIRKELRLRGTNRRKSG